MVPSSSWRGRDIRSLRDPMRDEESLNLGAGRALEPKTPIFMAGSVAINSLKMSATEIGSGALRQRCARSPLVWRSCISTADIPTGRNGWFVVGRLSRTPPRKADRSATATCSGQILILERLGGLWGREPFCAKVCDSKISDDD